MCQAWCQIMFPPAYKRIDGYPVGLTNPLSYICYFNSLIQVLFVSPQFRDYVNQDINHEQIDNANHGVPKPISREKDEEYRKLHDIQLALRTLLKIYDRAKNPEELEIARDKVVALIFGYKKTFDNPYGQQDVVQFMEVCLEAIGYSFKVTRSQSAEYQCAESQSMKTKLSGREGPYHALQISISEEGKQNLQELVNAYVSQQMYEKWDPADSPNLHFDSYKETFAISSRIPKVLTIQLKRFMYDNKRKAVKKTERPCGIGNGEIDLKEWISEDLRKKDGGSTKYLLQSFIIHNNEHYTSCVRKRKQWFLLNDVLEPQKLSTEDALKMTENGYVFVFEREIVQHPVV